MVDCSDERLAGSVIDFKDVSKKFDHAMSRVHRWQWLSNDFSFDHSTNMKLFLA